MKKILLFLVTILLFQMVNVTAQAHEGHDHNAVTQHVALKFSAMVGTQNFACGKSYDNIGITKSRIIPSDFRFFVTGVELIDKTGKAVPVKLDQDEVWQYEDVALLDFEDGTGPCRNGNSGIHTEVTGTVPQGDYNGVRFTLGVPFKLNHGDPTIAPSPLNFTAMFWVWQSGYKFTKIDMATSGQPQDPKAPPEMSIKDKLAAIEKISTASGATGKKPVRAAGFSIHLGSTDCASPSLTTPPSQCRHPNRVTITFNNFDINKNIIVADLAALLADTNVDINAPDTAPGCMSGPTDADCAHVFSAFGLPFGDIPATQQKFFSVR
jgi:uncharacterized repeat protein (TIGR04052 family)